jgi:hypothetical protein
MGVEKLPERIGCLENLSALGVFAEDYHEWWYSGEDWMPRFAADDTATRRSPFAVLPPGLASLKHLKSLNFCNSFLQEIPEFIGELPELSFLDIHGCPVKTRPPTLEHRSRRIRSTKISDGKVLMVQESKTEQHRKLRLIQTQDEFEAYMAMP